MQQYIYSSTVVKYSFENFYCASVFSFPATLNCILVGLVVLLLHFSYLITLVTRYFADRNAASEPKWRIFEFIDFISNLIKNTDSDNQKDAECGVW